MELNRSLNDKNAQSFPKQGKAAACLYAFQSTSQKRKKKKEAQGSESRISFLDPWKKKKKKRAFF